MQENIVVALVGVCTGAIGYLAVTFWMRPVLRYLEIKEQVLSDLIYYANVVNSEGLTEEMKERFWRRVNSNRRHAADLTACQLQLPFWFRFWHRVINEKPEIATTNLIGLANTFNELEAAERVGVIKRALRVKTELV